MRNFASYRITAHVCLYFAFVQLTTLFRNNLWTPIVLCALIFAASFAAVRFEKPWVRALVSLIPAAALALAQNALQLAVLVLPIGYLVIMMALGRMEMEQWQFQKEFALLCVPGVIAILLSLMFRFTIRVDESYSGIAEYCFWGLLALMIVFCILALRSMRAGHARSFKWQAGNAGFFIGAILLGAAFGLFFRYGLLWGINVLVMILLAPILLVMWLVMYGCQWLMEWFRNFEPEEVVTPPPLIEGEQNPQPANTPAPADPDYFRKYAIDLDINWQAVIIGLIIIAAIALMIAVIAVSRRRRQAYIDPGADAHVSDEGGERSTFRRRRNNKKKNNAEKIRFIYRQYLSFLSGHGIMRVGSNTSGEISERANEILLETDEVFRALYRKARYGRSEDVTDEDVRLAEETFEHLVTNENLRPKTE